MFRTAVFTDTLNMTNGRCHFGVLPLLEVTPENFNVHVNKQVNNSVSVLFNDWKQHRTPRVHVDAYMSCIRCVRYILFAALASATVDAAIRRI